MLTLYFAPFTRSHLARFALEELALPHELVQLDLAKGEHKSAAYLEVNPLGQLPALIDDGAVICESAAIALHLADKVPEKGLAPVVGSPERAAYYHWTVFAVASELAALAKIALHTRVLPEAARSAAVAAEGRRDFAEVAAVLSRAVRGRRYILGDRFSMADVMVGGSLWLAGMLGELAAHPELVAYHGRVSDRPAFQRAFASAPGASGR